MSMILKGFSPPANVVSHPTRLVRRGRPRSEAPKLALTVRYDADIVAAIRATGKGWQPRMNAALRQWLSEHTLA